jgi:hypothetical protein
MLANISFWFASLQDQYPAVYQLPVHLENEQNIYFEENETLEETLNRSTKTALTEWFNSNKINIEGREGTDYCD